MEVCESDEKIFQKISDLKFALNEANNRNKYVEVVQNYKSYKETLNRLLQIEDAVTMIQIQQDAIKQAILTVKEKLEEIIQEI